MLQPHGDSGSSSSPIASVTGDALIVSGEVTASAQLVSTTAPTPCSRVEPPAIPLVLQATDKSQVITAALSVTYTVCYVNSCRPTAAAVLNRALTHPISIKPIPVA